MKFQNATRRSRRDGALAFALAAVLTLGPDVLIDRVKFQGHRRVSRPDESV